MGTRMTRHALDPARAEDLLASIMPVGNGETPLSVLGWRDNRGRIRRVRADYPNGWRLYAYFSAAGQLTSHRGQIRLTTRTRAR